MTIFIVLISALIIWILVGMCVVAVISCIEGTKPEGDGETFVLTILWPIALVTGLCIYSGRGIRIGIGYLFDKCQEFKRRRREQ